MSHAKALIARLAARWICQCGAVNPDITNVCLRCGK